MRLYWVWLNKLYVFFGLTIFQLKHIKIKIMLNNKIITVIKTGLTPKTLTEGG